MYAPKIYTSRNLFGLTWAEFDALVRCFALDCTMSRDSVFGEWVRFTPKDMAQQLKQLCAMSEHKDPSPTYSAMVAVLRAVNETLRTCPETTGVTPRNITIYQRSR